MPAKAIFQRHFAQKTGRFFYEVASCTKMIFHVIFTRPLHRSATILSNNAISDQEYKKGRRQIRKCRNTS